jgi:hypothetical protein
MLYANCPKCHGPLKEKKTLYVDPDELDRKSPEMFGEINAWEECPKCGFNSEREKSNAMVNKDFVRQQQWIHLGEPGFQER